MEGVVASSAAPPRGGGFRGRGGAPMRGGFERGRGRGMGGRGHFMNRGFGGPSPPHGPHMPGGPRNMRPRGGPGGFQSRGGFHPRGAPMGMRGGRPPMYQQPPKQHTGSDNNKTVSPVPAAVPNEQQATTEAVVDETNVTTATPQTAAATTGNVPSATAPNAQAVSNQQTVSNTGPPQQYNRPLRGRGGYNSRGRGGYNPHLNGGNSGMYGGPHHGSSGGSSIEHGQMPRRGAMRGRGGYGMGMSRPPMHQQHNANAQIAPVQAIKRGAPGGPGPKRGRYEGGPYTQRPIVPKYHAPPHMNAVQTQPNYGAAANHHAPPQSHHSYATHEQSQQVDPYAQTGYNAQTAQASYNGYGQSGGYAAHTAQQSTAVSGSYGAHHNAEYDQSQYQNYNSAGYGTQQDTRYQSYGHDYTQQYGAAALDYNTSTTDYTQHGQQSVAYDERTYPGYDTQSYQQNYSNAAGYY